MSMVQDTNRRALACLAADHVLGIKRGNKEARAQQE